MPEGTSGVSDQNGSTEEEDDSPEQRRGTRQKETKTVYRATGEIIDTEPSTKEGRGYYRIVVDARYGFVFDVTYWLCHSLIVASLY
ncbi:hypothetical protein NDU88_005791 [Pleurodeles waltl]|uniref:Uncharacterized protein n=1 Tax=Pleurodeles waltl TaxID=8319 RepID=A0AAV7TWF0_PLEWA|nr:hypothetical protein NDU88_005791 [Pleurodeles waltl]